MKWSFELLARFLGMGRCLFLPYFSRLEYYVVYLLLFLKSKYIELKAESERAFMRTSVKHSPVVVIRNPSSP